MAAEYLFYVHNRANAWRLVLSSSASRPPEFCAEDWKFTRARDPQDVNDDVRRLCDRAGYCLFKIGASFDELKAELSQRGA